MVSRFRRIKEILTFPLKKSDYPIDFRSNFLLPDFLQALVSTLVTLLSIPTLIVVCWVVEHAFFIATSFGWEAFGALALPLGSCILAALVFLSRNPMHSLLSLLGVFFSTVLMYLIAGIAFVGLVFLIVYVGAVAVLFLFVIMLLNVKSLTSEDELIRHLSQVAAILGAVLLLQQTHRYTISSLNRSMADGFLRDAAVEPTTGEAVFFQVRFLATDINALTGLYTTHAILFLVTTGILLAALLGAIILATVTTERATSISDIRQYSTHPMLPSVALATIVMVAVPVSLIDSFLTNMEFTSILMSAPLYRVNDDKFLRNVRQRSWRHRRNWPIVDSRHTLLDDRIVVTRFTAPLRAPTRVQELYNEKIVLKRRVFGQRRRRIPGGHKYQDALLPYKNKLYGILLNKSFPFWHQRHCALKRSQLFRLQATAALAPVTFKLQRRRNLGTIVRQRWLWRWRRDRAISRFRFDRKYFNDAPSDWGRYLARYNRRPYCGSYRTSSSSIRRRSHFYRRWIFAHPRISFRWSPLKYLRYLISTYVVTRVWYWAWRFRAFCIMFVFYLFLVPGFTLIAYFFYEDYVTVFENIAKVYTNIHEKWFHAVDLYKYSDAPRYTWTDRIVACLFLFPAIYVAWLVKYATYMAGLAAIFAYDTVLMHGGELSDIEFHESRCNYWRKLGGSRRKARIDAQAVIDLARARQHPDKDRVDYWPLWLVFCDQAVFQKLPTWASEPIYKGLNYILPKYWYFELNYLSPTYWYIKGVITYIENTQVYRCLSAIPRTLLSIIIKKYPFLLDWYLAGIEGFWGFIGGVGTFFYASWCFWCQEIWPYISYAARMVDYRPVWIDRLFLYYPFGATFLTFVLIVVGFIYSFCSLLISLHWRRVCGKTFTRRPSVLLPLFILLLSLYALAIFFYKWQAASWFLDVPVGQGLMYVYYEEYEDFWETVKLHARWPLLVLWLGFVWRFAEIVGWYHPEPRSEVETLGPGMLRAYFNVWVAWAEKEYLQDELEFEEELEPFDSAAEAYAEAAIEDEDQDYIDYREEQAKLIRETYVAYTYIPKYYDKHPHALFHAWRFTDAYFSDKHHGNAFH